tara:strand:- start:276 stop:674 length:399 start_codon:yes stop_codon:yes gene_type:complete
MNNTYGDIFIEVAKCADLCIKPFKHSVVSKNIDYTEPFLVDKFIELILLIETRNQDGERLPEKDLDVEIYRSGSDLNITLTYDKYPESPILWQGKYSFWMDASSGKRCENSSNGQKLEALARRLRVLFSSMS